MNKWLLSFRRDVVYTILLFSSFLIMNNTILFAQGNIQVQSISVPGASSECNTPITAQLEVCNIGAVDLPAADWELQVYFFDSASNTVFQETIPSAALQSGACVTFQTSGSYTPQETGNYSVFVEAYYANDTDNSDNSKTKNFSVDCTPPTEPDLIIEDIIVPDSTAACDTPFKPRFTVCNINSLDAQASAWDVDVFIFEPQNNTPIFSETIAGSFIGSGSPQTPACITLETEGTFTPAESKRYKVFIRANDNDGSFANDWNEKYFNVECTPSGYAISGNILEDANYGGNLGNYLGTPRPNVLMELYRSNGNYISSATTNSDGLYSFSNVAAGDYIVRAVNNTVTSARPRNAGAEGNPIPVQTYRTNASSGSPVDIRNKIGGEVPWKTDAETNNGGKNISALTTTFTTPQSITNVKVTGSDVTGINFAFNFSTIVNTNGDAQGSLRQFIINSNTLSNNGLAQVGQTAGIESSIFMIPSTPDPLNRPPDPNFNGATFEIAPFSAYPSIVDKVRLDGFIQTGLSGNSNLDSPEIILDGRFAGETSTGLSFLVSDCILTGMTIQKFGGNGVFCNSKIYLGTANQKDRSVECLSNGFHGIQAGSVDYVGDNFLLLKNNGQDGIRVENSLDVDGIQSMSNSGWGVHFGEVFLIRRIIGNRAYFWNNKLGGISGINGLLSGSYIDCNNNGQNASEGNANEGHGIIVKNAVLNGVSSTENKKDGISAETIIHKEVNGSEKLTAMNNGGCGVRLKGTMVADGIFIEDNNEWGIISENGNIFIKKATNSRNVVWRNGKGGVSVKSGTFNGKFMDFNENGSNASSDSEGYGLVAKHVIVNGIGVSESKNDGIKAESIIQTRRRGQENLLSINNGGDGLNIKGNITADGIEVVENMGWGAISENGNITIKSPKSKSFAFKNKLGGISAVNGALTSYWLSTEENGELAQSLSEGHGIIAGLVIVKQLSNGDNKGDGIRAQVVNVSKGFSISDNEGYGIIASQIGISGIIIARNKKGGIRFVRNVPRLGGLPKTASLNGDNKPYDVDIMNSTISDNDGRGIDVGIFEGSQIVNNNIMRNTGYDLFSRELVVQANNNWWGENSSPVSKINDLVKVDEWLADSVSLFIFPEIDSLVIPLGTADSILFSVINVSNSEDSLAIDITDSLNWFKEISYDVGINDSTHFTGAINFTVPSLSGRQNKISITAASLISGKRVEKNIFVTTYTPTYSSLRILEDSLTIGFGDTIYFSAIKIDQNNNEVETTPAWSSSGGIIDNSGMFISDSINGVIEIIAEDLESGISQSADIYNTDEEIVLTEINISPSTINISPGGVFKFSSSGKNQFGFPMEFTAVWEAAGGTINVNGLFIAGENSGNYQVKVSDSSGVFSSTANINILVGIESDEEIIPKTIRLSQNYPNPFNPSTIINYSVPKLSYVSLKVYDLLGREIKSLVSEKKPPGNYNVMFKSDALSSSIYFYKLQVGSFIETKKMILLK